MAKGGARVGAGRKPKKDKPFGQAGVDPAPSASSTPPDPALLEPPAHLTEDERAVWARLAPLSAANGMLTKETAPGLEHLCEVWVMYHRLRATLEAEGWQITLHEKDEQGNVFPLEQKRHPLWPQLQAFAIRREQGLRSFGLLANGKPVSTAAPPAGPDPWAERARNQPPAAGAQPAPRPH
jgi:P27 family predicted phage terminase small subunit